MPNLGSGLCMELLCHFYLAGVQQIATSRPRQATSMPKQKPSRLQSVEIVLVGLPEGDCDGLLDGN